MENAENSEGITNPYEKPKDEETPLKEESPEKEEEKQQAKQNKNKIKLMSYLFTFIQNNEKSLNVTSVGYFAKLINALLNKRFLEVF